MIRLMLARCLRIQFLIVLNALMSLTLKPTSAFFPLCRRMSVASTPCLRSTFSHWRLYKCSFLIESSRSSDLSCNVGAIASERTREQTLELRQLNETSWADLTMEMRLGNLDGWKTYCGKRERERGRKRERGGRESELEKDNEQKHTGDWSGDSGRDPDSSEKKRSGFFKGLATLRYIHYNGISINIALHCIAFACYHNSCHFICTTSNYMTWHYLTFDYITSTSV